jgi:hypothetical protein
VAGVVAVDDADSGSDDEFGGSDKEEEPTSGTSLPGRNLRARTTSPAWTQRRKPPE